MEITDIVNLLNTKGNTILKKENMTKIESDFLEKYKDSITVEDYGKYYLLKANKKLEIGDDNIRKSNTTIYELWQNGNLCYSGSIGFIAKKLDISKSYIYKHLKRSGIDSFETHGYVIKKIK